LRTAPALPAVLPDAKPPLQLEFVSAGREADVSLDPPAASSEPAAGIIFEDVAVAPNDAAMPSLDALVTRWLVSAVFGIWLAGAAVWFAVAAIRIAHFRRILRRAEPAPAELLDEVARLADRVGLRQAPHVRLVRRHGPPLVWAMTGRATILLPAELLPTLSDEQRRALLTHELVHLARRDHLVRWAELAALGLYWWHPIAWWARRNVERAAEQCCDAEVVALLGSARAYAEALLATVDFLAESRPALPMGASGFSQVLHLKRRMEMILHPATRRPATWSLRLALLTIGLAMLPLSIRTLWAEPASPPTEPASATVEPSAPVEPPADPTGAKKAVTATLPAQVEPQSNRAEERLGITPQPATTIEQRLERLEKMIQALADQKQTTSAPPPKPATLQVVSPKAAPAKRAAAPATASYNITFAPPSEPSAAAERVAPAQPAPVGPALGLSQVTPYLGQTQVVPAREKLQIYLTADERKNTLDAPGDPEKLLAEFRMTAERNIKLVETNYARRVAAERQLEAVKAAYEAETVTLDQVLEAQRRWTETRISYARTVSDLATVPAAQREYVFALACLKASNDALNDAKQIWKKVHAAYVAGSEGGEAKEEAQAREQYLQFKAQFQKLLSGYLKAKAAYEGRKAADPFAD
jgi:beta-lactamase regulating signal transducer with metallopeptidase domain